MKKLKVMTIVGTRPEIIRLSAVINKLEDSEAIEHILVHTGQNYDYELNGVFFEDFRIASITLFGSTPGYRNTYITDINRVIESESEVNPYKINKNHL